MTTIIKLVIALLILNAVAQAGMAAFKYYKFEDTVHEALLFSGNASDADLVERIAEIADEQGVPVDAAHITVRRERFELIVEMSYDEDVTLVPGLYTKTWTFTPSASARSLNPQPGKVTR